MIHSGPRYPPTLHADKPSLPPMSRIQNLKRPFLVLQTAWSIAGVTLLLAMIFELFLRGAFWLKDLRGIDPPPDRRVLAQGYDGATWPRTHYRELAALS